MRAITDSEVLQWAYNLGQEHYDINLKAMTEDEIDNLKNLLTFILVSRESLNKIKYPIAGGK